MLLFKKLMLKHDSSKRRRLKIIKFTPLWKNHQMKVP